MFYRIVPPIALLDLLVRGFSVPPTHTICMIRELCAPLRTLFEHIIYPFVLFATFFARMVKILRIDYEKKKKIRENVLISIMVADSRHPICLKL